MHSQNKQDKYMQRNKNTLQNDVTARGGLSLSSQGFWWVRSVGVCKRSSRWEGFSLH